MSFFRCAVSSYKNSSQLYKFYVHVYVIFSLRLSCFIRIYSWHFISYGYVQRVVNFRFCTTKISPSSPLRMERRETICFQDIYKKLLLWKLKCFKCNTKFLKMLCILLMYIPTNYNYTFISSFQ